MPEKSPFAEGNLGMQRYQIRYYMKRFIGGILNAKPSEDTSRWRIPSKSPAITNIALEEQRYLFQKKIAHENLILSQHIHDIKTENRKETTIEYADGWRIAKSGGNTRPVIDCYPTQRRIALNFHNLHSRKHVDEKNKKKRAYQDERMAKNIQNYKSEYNIKVLKKSYDKKKFLMTNMSSKIPRTVLHIGLKTEALRAIKREKMLSAGLRPPPLKNNVPNSPINKKHLELPKWNDSPVINRKELQELVDHPIYPSSVELLGPLYAPIDLTKINKVPTSTIKLSSSLKLDREIPTLPQSQSQSQSIKRPLSAGNIRPLTINKETENEKKIDNIRPKSAINITKIEKNISNSNTISDDWNLYEKIPLKKVSKVQKFNDNLEFITPDTEKDIVEQEEDDDDDDIEGTDEDIDAFDQYLIDRYMAVIGQDSSNELIVVGNDVDVESSSNIVLDTKQKFDSNENIDVDQEPSFLELPNARKIIICESAIPAFAILNGDNEIPICRYIIRISDVGLISEIDDSKNRKVKKVSTTIGLLIEASPIIENDESRDNVHSHCLPNKADSSTKDLIETIQNEVKEQIIKEQNYVDENSSYLSCNVLIRIPALKALCMATRNRNLVRALNSLKEIPNEDGHYLCLSDHLDPPSEESLCGLLLSSIGIELHPLQQNDDDYDNNINETIWAARISLNP